MFSIGAKPAFVSAQTGDSIKTLEAHYVKYLPQADSGRELVEKLILESGTKVKPSGQSSGGETAGRLQKRQKPLGHQGLSYGAGEEGRTPDLMLGKHTL